MLKDYSSSYKLGISHIEPINYDSTDSSEIQLSLPRISPEQYSILRDWYENHNISSTEPVIKMGNSHFNVSKGDDLKEDTLKVPRKVIPPDMSVPSKGRYLVLTPEAYEWMSKNLDPTNIKSNPLSF